MKKYKNIIFDLGAVLVNWKPKEVLANIFKNKPTMEWQNWYKVLHSKPWDEMEKGKISLEETAQRLSHKYDKKVMIYCFDKIPEYLFPLEEMLKIFDQIKNKNYKTYVLSNFGKEFFNKANQIHDYENKFLNRFDGKIISFEVGAAKPKPEIYKILLETYKINPKESIFIDDKEENIIAAQDFGIDGIVCQNHNQIQKELIEKGVI